MGIDMKQRRKWNAARAAKRDALRLAIAILYALPRGRG